MVGVLLILASYFCLIMATGWTGVIAAIAHAAILLLAMKRE